MSIEKIKVNGRIYDIRDVEDVKKEETRAVAAEKELLARIQGVSENSNSRQDPFKVLGDNLDLGFSSYDAFNVALDDLLHDSNVSGSNVGYFRASIGYRGVEINNILLSSGSQNIVQVVKGAIKIANDKVANDDSGAYRILYRQHLNSGWGEWKEFVGNSSGSGGSVDLTDYVKKSELDNVAFSGRYDDLSGLPTIPNESKVEGWGFTKNNGTVTGVKINGVTKSPNTGGLVDLGTIESGGGTTVINGVTDVTVDGVTAVRDNVAIIPLASTSSVGVVQLSNDVDSDSETKAASSAAVKTVNDKVNGKQDAISDIAEIRTNASNAFKGTINNLSSGDIKVVSSVNGIFPSDNSGAVTIDVGDKNVQSDWNATSGDAFIKNKPTIPTTLDQLTQSASYRTVTDTEKSTWGGKQDKLVSGTNLKTINGESLLGSGDIAISSGGLSQETDPIFSASPAAGITEENITDWDSKQDAINDIATIRENASSAFKGTINGNSNGTLWLVEKVNGQTADSTGNVSVPVAYPKVAHGTNDATFTLTPNVFHVWGGMGTLTLTLGAEANGVANEYLFQFTGGSGGTTLVLPDSVKWADGAAPTIEAFKTYQVSILENCATIQSFG